MDPPPLQTVLFSWVLAGFKAETYCFEGLGGGFKTFASGTVLGIQGCAPIPPPLPTALRRQILVCPTSNSVCERSNPDRPKPRLAPWDRNLHGSQAESFKVAPEPLKTVRFSLKTSQNPVKTARFPRGKFLNASQTHQNSAFQRGAPEFQLEF